MPLPISPLDTYLLNNDTLSIFTRIKMGDQLAALGNPSGAAEYYVDLNILTSGDGLSWGSAFSTIAAAITASNASIGLLKNRWWARRNIINVVGDGITESLTILPEKCDIIGRGADLYAFPRITGNHVIAVAKVGCRFINMGFVSAANADLFDIPAGCFGLSFLAFP